MSATYVLGAGAIGFPLAAFLADAGRPVVAVRTSRSDVDEQMVTVDVHGAGGRLSARVRTVSLARLERLDGMVVVTTKAHVNEALAAEVAGFDVRDPAVPVWSPTGVTEVRTAADVRRVLIEALTSPVAWAETLAVAAGRWPDAPWRECGPSCSLHRFVWKNGLKLDWGEA